LKAQQLPLLIQPHRQRLLLRPPVLKGVKIGARELGKSLRLVELAIDDAEGVAEIWERVCTQVRELAAVVSGVRAHGRGVGALVVAAVVHGDCLFEVGR